MFIVYSKENCQPCKTAISLLEDKGIEHKVYKLVAGEATCDNEINVEEFKQNNPTVRAVPHIVHSETGRTFNAQTLADFLK